MCETGMLVGGGLAVEVGASGGGVSANGMVGNGVAEVTSASDGVGLSG